MESWPGRFLESRILTIASRILGLKLLNVNSISAGTDLAESRLFSAITLKELPLIWNLLVKLIVNLICLLVLVLILVFYGVRNFSVLISW